MHRALFTLLAACSQSVPLAAVVTKPSLACAAPEYRQLDFWIGDWDVAIRARATAEAPWGQGVGHQHVEAILGGCAIAEHFAADGPQKPWAGASYSSWQPAAGMWRQTWVDDSGGYLAFQGKLTDGKVMLYGEPRVVSGTHFQMRMVFEDISPTSLHWEWQRSDDDWRTEAALMAADYRRAR